MQWGKGSHSATHLCCHCEADEGKHSQTAVLDLLELHLLHGAGHEWSKAGVADLQRHRVVETQQAGSTAAGTYCQAAEATDYRVAEVGGVCCLASAAAVLASAPGAYMGL